MHSDLLLYPYLNRRSQILNGPFEATFDHWQQIISKNSSFNSASGYYIPVFFKKNSYT